MDIREIVISEFVSVLKHYEYKITPELLRIAEAPFNLHAVQQSVDFDIQQILEKARFSTEAERSRNVYLREKYHENALRKLSRQYAIKILKYTRLGNQLSISAARDLQRSLKEEAGSGCDFYPCDLSILR